MYALPNKTQHKLIVKVRGGISQKLDNFSSNSQPGNQNYIGAGSSISSDSKSSSSISSRPSSSSSLSRHIDEAGFNAELSHLPQPVFHSINQHGNKQKSSLSNRAQKQFITPEHNEMIKYVQQSWKGVERDYKKSVNNFINNIDINSTHDNSSTSPSSPSRSSSATQNHLKQRQQVSAAKKKTATTSTPLLLSGSYHHTSSLSAKDSGSSRQDSFRPFDLETFWGNRILQRLTKDI